MRILRDFEGRAIRLTDERRQHILEHPEMSGLGSSIGETLANPQRVLQSLGDKFLSVVVRLAAADAFVVTAYLTDRVKKGKRIWPTER